MLAATLLAATTALAGASTAAADNDGFSLIPIDASNLNAFCATGGLVGVPILAPDNASFNECPDRSGEQ
jgi:predicted Zn-dependent protease